MKQTRFESNCNNVGHRWTGVDFFRAFAGSTARYGNKALAWVVQGMWRERCRGQRDDPAGRHDRRLAKRTALRAYEKPVYEGQRASSRIGCLSR